MELDVNIETGAVRLLSHTNVCDPGTRINPQAVDGQIDGAIAFGIGFAYLSVSTQIILPHLKVTDYPQPKMYPRNPVLRRGSTGAWPFGAKSMAEHPDLLYRQL